MVETMVVAVEAMAEAMAETVMPALVDQIGGKIKKPTQRVISALVLSTKIV